MYSLDLILMDDPRVSSKYSQLPPNIAKFGDSRDPGIIAARGQVTSHFSFIYDRWVIL